MKSIRYFLILITISFSFLGKGQTCEGFHSSGIKCTRPAVERNHCELHEIQQYHYCRFTKTVAPGIINQFIRVEEYDIEGLKKKDAEKLAEQIKIEKPDTISITNNGIELAFGNFNEYKKYYLNHVHIEPFPGKPGFIRIVLSYAKLEKWM